MAVRIIPERICPHCGGIRWYVAFNRGYNQYCCPVKRAEYIAAYRKTEKGKQALNKAVKRWIENNKDRYTELTRRYQKTRKGKMTLKKALKKYRNSPKGRANIKRYNSRLSQSLRDSYIRGQLKNDIPNPTPEQMDKYRKHLKLIRQCQQAHRKDSIK